MLSPVLLGILVFNHQPFVLQFHFLQHYQLFLDLWELHQT